MIQSLFCALSLATLSDRSQGRFGLLRRFQLIRRKCAFHEFPLAKVVTPRASPKGMVFVKNQLLTTAAGRVQSGSMSIFRCFHRTLRLLRRNVSSNGSAKKKIEVL